MSKSRTLPFKEKKRIVLYPSDYGSHSSMINKEKTESLNNKFLVVCTDERGDYITQKARLDNGLADSFRFANLEFRKDLLEAN